MDDRWRQVEELFHAVREQPADRRAAILEGGCGDDAGLRLEVESLLARDAEGTAALDRPAWDGVEDLLSSASDAPLPAGTSLGPYRISGVLGASAMGRVYRAHDSRLARDVAIKISGERFSSRFEREALAVAALNHPNICTVYDVGPNYLVMEMVDGPTLADRIAQGCLPMEEALQIARQIADALESAHEKGIVHRDLKPANVKVKPNGTVKVLDFGLATRVGDQARAETVTGATQPGTILGTAAYMSPEQARGKQVDKRADVWAFGVVLYEMLTGKRPFEGATLTDILAAVVKGEPDWDLAPAKTRRLLRSCLEKDPERRLRHIGDFALLLDGSPQVRRRTFGMLAGAAAAAIFAIGAAIISWNVWRPASHPAETGALRTVKFTFTPTRLRRGSERDIDAEVSVSHDGRHIGYVEARGGQLMVRDLDQEQARQVPGATNVYQAFWSPDGRFIGYADGSNLMRIPAQGGAPATICKLAGEFRGATWSDDGETIVYCDTTGMYTVPAAGGAATRIVEHPHIEQPSFLELHGGRHAFLFQAVERLQPGHQIEYQVVGEQTRHPITTSSSSNPYPVYSPTGHILYGDGAGDATAIWALPFSLATLKPTGAAFPIAQHGSSPKLARTGTLVYSDVPSGQLNLVWCDRSGKKLGTIGPPRLYSQPSLSPDGRRLAVHVGETGFDIWSCDVDRGVMSRVTFDANPRYVSWSPAGDEIAYSSFVTGSFRIMSKAWNGTGEAKTLRSTEVMKGPQDWSPDYRYLIYETISHETKGDLFCSERHKDGSLGEPVTFLQSPFDEGSPKFSPDGQFVAYVSDESGRDEIYVRTFPGGDGKWRVSTNGGTAPRWRRDGKELFYVQRTTLMAVTIRTAPRFTAGTPARLFERQMLESMNPEYDVTPDGKRFLVREEPTDERPLAIHVVDNWFEEFRRPRPK